MNKLFLGDCIDIMSTLPDGCVDMVFCDLPYGTTQNEWDVLIPFDKLWAQYNRVVKENGAIVLTAQSLPGWVGPFQAYVLAAQGAWCSCELGAGQHPEFFCCSSCS